MIAEQRLGRTIMTSPLPELAGVRDGTTTSSLRSTSSSISMTTQRRWRRSRRKLKPGGKFVMTVPAHRWMWSAHDVVNHHKRRYSKAGLKRLIEGRR